MSSDEASSDAGAAEEVDPDLAAMWQRFQHLTDKLSASNERSDAIKTELQQPKKREPHTPAHFPSLELNELVPDSAAGAEHVDVVADWLAVKAMKHNGVVSQNLHFSVCCRCSCCCCVHGSLEELVGFLCKEFNQRAHLRL
jgi:hypothetical protein